MRELPSFLRKTKKTQESPLGKAMAEYKQHFGCLDFSTIENALEIDELVVVLTYCVDHHIMYSELTVKELFDILRTCGEKSKYKVKQMEDYYKRRFSDN